MSFNDFALIPKADYKDACDAIREKTDKTKSIVSGEMGDLIRGITSGGMTASIFVTGLSESDTVTASYGDKTKVAVWNSTESRHEITGIADKGTWTVTATNGENTAMQDVLVDGAFDYEIEMPYVLWLYREGDECEDVTGGWSATGYTYAGFRASDSKYVVYSVSAGTKNADNLHVKGITAPSGGKGQLLGTNNAINFSGYTKLFADVNRSNTVGAGLSLSLSKDCKMDGPNNTIKVLDISTSGRTTYEFSLNDIGISEPHFMLIFAANNTARELNVYNIWLE